MSVFAKVLTEVAVRKVSCRNARRPVAREPATDLFLSILGVVGWRYAQTTVASKAALARAQR